jgi:hypothetical protein
MSQATFTLTQEEYEALVALARQGLTNDDGELDANRARVLDDFLKNLESRNGFTRDAVWVQWQELDEPLPAGTKFPEKWPPDKRAYVEMVTRSVTQADVERTLDAQAKNPTSVMVTRDPGATVGWVPIDDFFY